jgi:NAD(P)-dependent dehydrogenase (short-subunit alcohol dehydrogenase family)
MRLVNKVGIISGAASGMGAATARIVAAVFCQTATAAAAQ